MNKIIDGVRMRTRWSIDKFRDPDNTIAKLLQGGASLDEVIKQFPDRFIAHEAFDGNVGLNEGLQELIRLIAATDGSPVKWDNTNAFIGVGDSSATPTDPTLTGLQGSNKAYKLMDATYPQRTTQTCEWRATYGSAEGNFAWEEFTVSNTDSDSGKNLNRKCISKGTKASGETWTAVLQITFS
jgi:hypothetical protein